MAVKHTKCIILVSGLSLMLDSFQANVFQAHFFASLFSNGVCMYVCDLISVSLEISEGHKFVLVECEFRWCSQI